LFGYAPIDYFGILYNRKEGENMMFETIRPSDIEKYIGQNNIIIIDLRDTMEYQDGHIPTAINIPYEEFEYKKNLISKNYLIILYCHRGSISLAVARDLSKEGFQVKNIYGGINAYRGRIEK
jgi:rhodanese-related sulfurtransferase